MASENAKRVLVVDSNLSWRQTIQDWLSTEFLVFAAGNYTDALEYIKNQLPPFHVIITEAYLDETRPDKRDGFDLIDTAVAFFEHTRTIVVTGDPIIAEYKEKKAFDYLEKYSKKYKNGERDPIFEELNCNDLRDVVRNAVEDSESNQKQNHIDIFVLMSFAKEYDHIYEYIQDVAKKMRKKCKRADNKIDSDINSNIMSDIEHGIRNAEVIIADLSDVKPNVLFEVGISYAWQKKVILIAKESEKRKVPDILSGRRIVFYLPEWGKEKKIKNSLQNRLREEFSMDSKARNKSVTEDSSLCFAFSSPTDDGQDTYDAIIKKPINETGMESIYLWDDMTWQRFDTELENSALIEGKLKAAGCVIADLSGDDPTAFYLAGVAYGYRKKYKFLYLQDQEPPFDIKLLNLLRHSKNSEFEREKTRTILHEWLQVVSQRNQSLLALEVDKKDNIPLKPVLEEKQSTLILFLAAEPTDQVRLRLGKEFREIKEELARSRDRDRFTLALPEFSLRAQDITRAMLEIEAQIIHFSGHGGDGGHLYFETESGISMPVQPNILADLFRQFSGKIKCIVLNACYSKKQAKAIAMHIDYVIGMRREISDRAAIAFSIGFYQALGAGKGIEDAFEFGKLQSGMQNTSEYQTPVLHKRRK